jgi:Cd2+/Zn2+-exporting ATPase
MEDKHVEFYVANLDCESEASAIQRGMDGFPGVEGLKVYAKSAKVSITFDPERVSSEELKEKLVLLGFPPQAGRAPAELPKPWRNPKVVTSAVSGVLLLAGWLLSLAGVPSPVSMGLYLAAIAIGGYYFGREAFEELIFEREVGIELLMAVAAIVATLMGEAMEGAMLVFLYSISEAAEGYTEEKTRSAVRALMDLAPKKALVRRDGQEIEIPVEAIVVGDVFIVKPGQSLPTDGTVIKGASSINQAPVTGESVPVPKAVGDEVFAGTINEEGALEVTATKAFADNTIARIIHMVEEAQEQKGKSQRFIERFGHRYSPIVLLIGVLMAMVPPLLFQAPWMSWLERATVFIVAAAPCALVISIPITLVAALGTGARNGVLIKGGVYVEELSKIKVVALDKTGTITMGEPEVTEVIPLGDRPAADVLTAAASIERLSAHPLARAITRYTDAQGVRPQELADFQSITGAGASGVLDGRTIVAASPSYFKGALGATLDEAVIARLQDEGKTVVVIGDTQSAWGLVAVRDNIRPNAKAAIAALRAAGVQKVAMLTGDNERAANAIAREVGIDEIHAELKPEDKVARVRALAKTHGHVAMVGDGVNDAPALAEATVGVAMGAAGSDVALETADVALMADDLEKLVYALNLAKRNQAIVNQNLALSAVVIGVLVVGAVAGYFKLPIAVLGHEISEFIVIASGLRMLRS